MIFGTNHGPAILLLVQYLCVATSGWGKESINDSKDETFYDASSGTWSGSGDEGISGYQIPMLPPSMAANSEFTLTRGQRQEEYTNHRYGKSNGHGGSKNSNRTNEQKSSDHTTSLPLSPQYAQVEDVMKKLKKAKTDQEFSKQLQTDPESIGPAFKTFEKLSAMWISVMHRIWKLWKGKGAKEVMHSIVKDIVKSTEINIGTRVTNLLNGNQSAGVSGDSQLKPIYGSARTMSDTLTRDINTRATSKLNVRRSRKAHRNHIKQRQPSRDESHHLLNATKTKKDNSSLRFPLTQTLKGIDSSILDHTKVIDERRLVEQEKVNTNLTITEAKSKQEKYYNESKDVKFETQTENESNINNTQKKIEKDKEAGSQNYEKEQKQTLYSGSGKILSAKYNIPINNDITDVELPAVNNRQDGSWSINSLPAEPSSISDESDDNEVAFNNFVDPESFGFDSASQEYNHLKESGELNGNNARSSLILRSTPLNGDAGFVDTQHMSANSDRKAKHSKKNLKDLNTERGSMSSLIDSRSNISGLDNGSQSNKDKGIDFEMENAKEAIKRSSKKEHFNIKSPSGIDDFGNLENISLTGDEGGVDEQDLPGEFLEGKENGKNQVEVDSETEIDDQGSADMIGSGENGENPSYFLPETPLKDKTKTVDNLNSRYLSKLQLKNKRLRYPHRKISNIVSPNGNLKTPGSEDRLLTKQRQGLKTLLLEENPLTNERTKNFEINKSISSSKSKFKFPKSKLRPTTAISRRKTHVYEPLKVSYSDEKHKTRSNSDKLFEPMVTNKKIEHEISLKRNLNTQKGNKGLLESNLFSNNNLEMYSNLHKSSKLLLGNKMIQKKPFVKKEVTKNQMVLKADHSRNKFKTRLKESIETQSPNKKNLEELPVIKQIKKQKGYEQLPGTKSLSSLKNEQKSLRISLQSFRVPIPDTNKRMSKKSGKNTFKRRENGTFFHIKSIDNNVLTNSKMPFTSIIGKQQHAALRPGTVKDYKTVRLKQKSIENQNTNIYTTKNIDIAWGNKQASDTLDRRNDRLQNQRILLKLKKRAKIAPNYQIVQTKDSKLNKLKSKRAKFISNGTKNQTVPKRPTEQLYESHEEKFARKTARSKIAATPTHSTVAKEVNLADKDPDNSEEKTRSRKQKESYRVEELEDEVNKLESEVTILQTAMAAIVKRVHVVQRNEELMNDTLNEKLNRLQFLASQKQELLTTPKQQQLKQVAVVPSENNAVILPPGISTESPAAEQAVIVDSAPHMVPEREVWVRVPVQANEPQPVPTTEEIPLSSLISPSSLTAANILSPQYSASEEPLQKVYAVQPAESDMEPAESDMDGTNTYLKLVIPGMKRGCIPGCKNGGRCVSGNTCKCSSFFYGDQCQKFSLRELINRSRSLVRARPGQVRTIVVTNPTQTKFGETLVTRAQNSPLLKKEKEESNKTLVQRGKDALVKGRKIEIVPGIQSSDPTFPKEKPLILEI